MCVAVAVALELQLSTTKRMPTSSLQSTLFHVLQTELSDATERFLYHFSMSRGTHPSYIFILLTIMHVNQLLPNGKVAPTIGHVIRFASQQKYSK